MRRHYCVRIGMAVDDRKLHMKHGITAATRTMFLTALLCVRAHRSVKIQTLGFARTSVLDDKNGSSDFSKAMMYRVQSRLPATESWPMVFRRSSSLNVAIPARHSNRNNLNLRKLSDDSSRGISKLVKCLKTRTEAPTHDEPRLAVQPRNYS